MVVNLTRRASAGLAGALLGGVDGLPALAADRVGLTLREQSLERGPISFRRNQFAGSEILGRLFHGFSGIDRWNRPTGKIRREVIRCLKRYLACELYRIITEPEPAATAPYFLIIRFRAWCGRR
jgi:hypothetical protein